MDAAPQPLLSFEHAKSYVQVVCVGHVPDEKHVSIFSAHPHSSKIHRTDLRLFGIKQNTWSRRGAPTVNSLDPNGPILDYVLRSKYEEQTFFVSSNYESRSEVLRRKPWTNANKRNK